MVILVIAPSQSSPAIGNSPQIQLASELLFLSKPDATTNHIKSNPQSRPSFVSVSSMFSSSPNNLPLKSSKARISDRDKKDTGWDHRYYDSYRPASRRGTSSENRSPTRATESEAVRHHSKKTWHQAKFSSKKTSQGDVSPILISSRGNSQDRSPLAASESDDKPPSTGHDPDHLTQMPSQQRKGTSIPTSSPTVDAEDEARESEAQSRGFYSPSRSRTSTSNAVTVAGYELKRRQDDGETDRSPKRSRGDENDRDRTANRPSNAEDDEPGGASDTYKRQCKNYMCMGDHTYENCDRPMICWGCRSTKYVSVRNDPFLLWLDLTTVLGKLVLRGGSRSLQRHTDSGI